MFRSIQETLHGPSTFATTTTATSNMRTQQQQQQQQQQQRVPARDTRQPSPLSRADDVDYISGVTFNIPIQDNDPTSIFSLLSAYVSAGSAGGAGTATSSGATTSSGGTGVGTAAAPANTGTSGPSAAAAAAAAASVSRNSANNTIGMRYSDITNNHRTYDACPITREPFATDERVLMLQCNHYFSENGLNRWLVSHSTCPVCRFNINNII